MANLHTHNPYCKYKNNPKLEEAYKKGWDHGQGIACHNVPRLGDRVSESVDYEGLGDEVVTAENIRDYHRLLCFAAEDNSRQYSPFEFTAHEFNSAKNGEDCCEDCEEHTCNCNCPDSESLWEAFDEGVNDSIMHDLSGYDDSDYGIEEDCEAE